ncbi:Fic family protein [Candidatus Saccharibacteria bacterium]|nr:Fic family protein [Candidatus Saccharibacteria bacterium]MBR0372487.1 Fic family protein [Candidatus Saccharibacteria bacterium]
MEYLSTSKIADKWGISERAVRKYCSADRIEGAKNENGIWLIPENAEKPERINQAKNRELTLLEILRREDRLRVKGGIYHKVQVELTYNSNHIEGSRLTEDQTRYIFETNTVGALKKYEGIRVDDVVETANHFRCIDYIIENANRRLSERMIKQLHFILKNGTSDSLEDWFSVGDYKKLPNEVGGMETTAPEQVKPEMQKLLKKYRERKVLDFQDLLNFHHAFECIHPFQDGNGRIGRLILFKECLRLDIIPFIIDEELKMFYYRGLKEWNNEKGFLTDTCRSAQDKFIKILEYYRITPGQRG